MTNDNKNARLIPNETTGTTETNNNQAITTLHLKSKCGDCFSRVIIESNNRAKTNESLSTAEKVKSLRQEIYDLSGIPIDMVINLRKSLRKRLATERKNLAHSVKENSKPKNKRDTDSPKEAVVRTVFKGKKSDFAKTAANYYFNEKNIFGLHLSHKQLDHITDMLCDNFIAEDGTFLSWRSVHDILKSGFKMDENGDYFV